MSPHTLEAIMDIKYMRAALASKVAWKVREDYTHIDHQATCMEIKGKSRTEGHVFRGVQARHIPGRYVTKTSHQNHRWVAETCDAATPKGQLTPLGNLTTGGKTKNSQVYEQHISGKRGFNRMIFKKLRRQLRGHFEE